MRKRPWLRWVLTALLVLLAASAGFSRALRIGRAHRFLNARLEAAFGRPVQVGHYSFSLLDGPRLEANSITVAEDPRFGSEYFLRAERLTAGLRWGSLLRGRFEFGTLSFTRPSLNLVRGADGHWNLESWLPPPPAAGGNAPAPSAMPRGRLYRIEVDSGRVNFKRGADKHPFALADLNGHVEQESAGRWVVDLEARPIRAAVSLQQTGTLRVRGSVGGTSARLQPAQLALDWQDASLADALRLLSGQDYGVRGRLALDVTARSEAPGANPANSSVTPASGNPGTGAAANAEEARGTRWSFAGFARVDSVHRWDLPHRLADPALNLRAAGQWRTGETRVEFSRLLLEAPQSSAHGEAFVSWGTNRYSQWQIASSGIAWADLLAWYRAFRPGVAEDAGLDGYAGVDLLLTGWPPRFEQGVVAGTGARLRLAGFPEPIRLGRITARIHRRWLELDPVAITVPASAREAPGTAGPAAVRLEGAVGLGAHFAPNGSRQWGFELDLGGQTDRAQDLLAIAAALGRTINHGWSVEGAANLHLHWQGSVRPFGAQRTGSIELRGLRLRTAYLNQPVSFASARIDLRPGEKSVTLTAAQAFGAHWKGTLRRRTDVAGRALSLLPWEFDLTADHLDTQELDRWLSPRARPAGLLERFLPTVPSSRSTAELDALLNGLHAQGSLRVDEFMVPPLSATRLRATMELDGRNLTLRDAQAGFYGGGLIGSLRAELVSQPAYHFQGQLERVNLGLLTDATTLKNRFAGTSTGALELSARGVGRENLMRSLEGRGVLEVRDAGTRGMDLPATYQAAAFRPGTSRFGYVAGQFSIAGSKVHLERLSLTDGSDVYQLEGDIAFSRTLDLRLERLRRAQRNISLPGASRKAAPEADPAPATLRIAGPLDLPQVNRVESAAAAGSRP